MTEALLSAAVGFAAAWLWRYLQAHRVHRLPVTVTIDSAHPQVQDVAGYFLEIAARLDECPEKMRVVFDSPSGIYIDLEHDGRLLIQVNGQRPRKLDLRRRWIADHPLPIALQGLVLYIDPVDANRFRVDDRVPLATSLRAALPLSLAATAGLILALPWLVGLAVGAACESALRTSIQAIRG